MRRFVIDMVLLAVLLWWWWVLVLLLSESLLFFRVDDLDRVFSGGGGMGMRK